MVYKPRLDGRAARAPPCHRCPRGRSHPFVACPAEGGHGSSTRISNSGDDFREGGHRSSLLKRRAAAIRYRRLMASSMPSTRRRFSPGQLALHAEALRSIVLASLAIRLLPFPRVTALGARPARRREPVEIAVLRGPVRGWGRRVPWRALCFETAVALRMMLARRGSARSPLRYRAGGGAQGSCLAERRGRCRDRRREADGFTEVGTFLPAPPR